MKFSLHVPTNLHIFSLVCSLFHPHWNHLINFIQRFSANCILLLSLSPLQSILYKHCRFKLPELDAFPIISNLKLIHYLKDEAGIFESVFKTKIFCILLLSSLLRIYFKNLILRTTNLVMVFKNILSFSIPISFLILFHHL